MDASLRRQVRERADGLCEYCLLAERFSVQSFHIEHVISKQHGGTDALDNLCLVCPDCNWHKGPNIYCIDPDTGLASRLYHPRRDAWTIHFMFNGGLILGLTDIGRTTTWLLGLNEDVRVQHRVLIATL